MSDLNKINKADARTLLAAEEEVLVYGKVWRKSDGRYAGKQVEGTTLPATLTWVKPK